MRIHLAVLLVASMGIELLAEVPRVHSVQTSSGDARLGEPKTLNGHFPFQVPENAGQWHQRAEQLRRRVLVATGLWPMPQKTPLNAVIHGKSERDGFTIEKVYFESLPGHYVTGLLFRPSDPKSKRSPAVLSPHGHGGRLQRYTEDEIKAQIAQGAEHFEKSGRTPKLARCVQLARMGCVTFIFDMIGYADSTQISREVAHRRKNARPEERAADESSWVFYSPQADLRLQSIMGLQTWNAIRSLDFLASLPDVDPNRLAVTGGSGGGTQSILLGAMDERIKVSFPNGMVSTGMQGGCFCENCNLLRIGTGNVELAALFAPRPQAMTAADDWTREMMRDGYPELKWLYAMIGDEADVYCRPMLHFKHNYNYVTRATMYQWMNRHLELGLDDPVIEQDFEPLTDQETAVWDEQHPSPETVGVNHEREVCKWLDEQSRAQLSAVEPQGPDSLVGFRKTFAGAWSVIFDQGLPATVEFDRIGESTNQDIDITMGILKNSETGTEIPLLKLHKRGVAPRGTIVWTTQAGKAAAFNESGQPSVLLSKLLDSKLLVLLPDLMGQGEWGGADANVGQRLVDDDRPYSAFSFGYNRTLVAERCADLLTVIAYANRANEQDVTKNGRGLCLLSTDRSAAWSAPAAALAGKVVDRVAISNDGFRYANVESYEDPYFVPGAVKYGDIQALFALRAPEPLMILGESELGSLVRRSYESSGAVDQLAVESSAAIDDDVISWLISQ